MFIAPSQSNGTKLRRSAMGEAYLAPLGLEFLWDGRGYKHGAPTELGYAYSSGAEAAPALAEVSFPLPDRGAT